MEDAEQQSDDLEELENTVIKGERKMQINRALTKINPEYRTVLHLLYFEDMTYDQIAIVLKKNKKQIRNLA